MHRIIHHNELSSVLQTFREAKHLLITCFIYRYKIYKIFPGFNIQEITQKRIYQVNGGKLYFVLFAILEKHCRAFSPQARHQSTPLRACIYSCHSASTPARKHV